MVRGLAVLCGTKGSLHETSTSSHVRPPTYDAVQRGASLPARLIIAANATPSSSNLRGRHRCRRRSSRQQLLHFRSLQQLCAPSGACGKKVLPHIVSWGQAAGIVAGLEGGEEVLCAALVH